MDPEPQLIAAVQSNNRTWNLFGLEPLNTNVMARITMTGTSPTFKKIIPIMLELIEAVQYPHPPLWLCITQMFPGLFTVLVRVAFWIIGVVSSLVLKRSGNLWTGQSSRLGRSRCWVDWPSTRFFYHYACHVTPLLSSELLYVVFY